VQKSSNIYVRYTVSVSYCPHKFPPAQRVKGEFQTSLFIFCRLHLKCDGTRTETRLRLSTKWMSPFELAQVSVQSTTGSRGVCTSSSNAGYTMFQGSVKSIGYPLHSPISPSLPLPCIDMCHHVSNAV